MVLVIEGNSEKEFISASIIEFIHLWRSRKDASMSLKIIVSFEFSLRQPELSQSVNSASAIFIIVRYIYIQIR